MSKWVEIRKGADFEAIGKKFGISPMAARILRNRDLCSDEEIEKFLRGTADMLNDPLELIDVEKGARVILDSIEKGEKIRVIGDYDVDGICSSYILVSGLKLLGADVDCVLPDRVKDGYGLSIKLVDEANLAGVNTIITCDNGIAAAEQTAHAKELGMRVVVTDHHEVPFETESKKEILPPADAVVDPKRAGGDCSFREICGAVVAYKFLQVCALVSGSEDKMKDFFDNMLVFAGIATVCDVMELREENRIIVKESLKRIAHTDNPGLKALINLNSLDPHCMSAYHYGFIIGPCLNATGRLDLATRALSLFTEKDADNAARIAGELKHLNDSRKDMTQQGVNMAIEMVEKRSEQGQLPKVILLFLPEVHESIAGIIAGRIKEKYHRPTIVLTKGEEELAKGSGRSVEKYDMFEELSACKDLFTKFGGHKMAAGMSLPIENVDILRDRLENACKLTDDDFEPVVKIDMELPFEYADLGLARELEVLEPFGTGNPKPLFARRKVRFLSGRIIGKNKNCGKYTVTDDGINKRELMFFGDMESFHDHIEKKFGKGAVDALYDYNVSSDIEMNICYNIGVNSFQGRESCQLIMNDYM